MIVDDLKNSILITALQGKLTEQLLSYSSAEDLLESIKNEKNKLVSEVKTSKKNQILSVTAEDLPFTIPNNWKWVRWGELSNSIQYGINTGAENNGNAKLVRISDIQDNRVIWEDVPYCKIDEKEIEQFLLNENDILFARTGGTVGKSVIVKDIPTDMPYVFAGYLIRSNYSSKMNYKYLKYFMESPLYWEQLRSGTIGSAQPNCNGQTLSKMILPLPPLEEQQRIVDKLDKLFNKLDEIKPIEFELNTLKECFPLDMKKSILLEAYNGIWSLENYESWSELELKKVAEIFTGNSISESTKKLKYMNLDSGYNYIATKDLNFDHSIDYENGVKIPFDETGFKYADKNSILMCIEGGSAGKKIGIVEEKVCFGNKLCKFECDSNIINHKYLYYFLQSPLFLKNFNNNLTGIIGGVSINKIKELLIKYPSLEEQQKIVDKIELLLPLCNDIEKIVNN